ncbi:Gfo/Idh/MocA family protein [Paenibacillus thermotolerans]|uniref:Gfo/Idh/MocA family protein n=1 Tax=Paenibacillus thermotolerans TaxID=3027807 RepID=UPI00236754D0|nr:MULTISPECIES: Gfo/Idh/MocA family oxidoreductase [unclassified Paenibacillus]
MNVGILGFAHGHVNGYCEEWANRPEDGISVVAGWDHDPKRLTDACRKFGLDACDDAASLLDRADVQAVVIASETSLHAELVELAASKGKAIVLQKPIALTDAEAERIVAAVRRYGVPFTMAWQMRVDPQNAQMKELLEGGEFGKVFSVRRRHGLGVGLSADFSQSWHVDPKYNRDIWADDSSHPIDFLHWLLGVPESVTAEVESLYNPDIPMDNGIAIFRYPGGPLAEVNCSFTCTAAENSTEIVCERGTIVQNYGDAVSCNAPRPEGAPGLKWYLAGTGQWTASSITTPDNHFMRIKGLAKPLADFLHGDREPIATAEEGRTSLRMVLATYVSSREGRRVSLNDPAISEV